MPPLRQSTRVVLRNSLLLLLHRRRVSCPAWAQRPPQYIARRGIGMANHTMRLGHSSRRHAAVEFSCVIPKQDRVLRCIARAHPRSRSGQTKSPKRVCVCVPGRRARHRKAHVVVPGGDYQARPWGRSLHTLRPFHICSSVNLMDRIQLNARVRSDSISMPDMPRPGAA